MGQFVLQAQKSLTLPRCALWFIPNWPSVDHDCFPWGKDYVLIMSDIIIEWGGGPKVTDTV